ncbi:MAG: hypothetical protein ACXVYW_16865 [Oryzihumus sp.]
MTHIPTHIPRIPHLPPAEREATLLAWRSLFVLVVLVALGTGAGALLGVALTQGFDSLNLSQLVATHH